MLYDSRMTELFRILVIWGEVDWASDMSAVDRAARDAPGAVYGKLMFPDGLWKEVSLQLSMNGFSSISEDIKSLHWLFQC